MVKVKLIILSIVNNYILDYFNNGIKTNKNLIKFLLFQYIVI
jgi:hypothetical protein